MDKGIDSLLEAHAFFEGLDAAALALIAGCGKNVRFPSGAQIARLGAPADHFYAVRRGRVSVEVHAPGRGPVIVETVDPGELLGWSWLFPPYTWAFDARAVEETTAIEFDGKCLRGKCDATPALGYELMKRFALLFGNRLAAARMQLLDLYAKPGY